MNFLITGATGFIGTELCAILNSQGHHIYALTRSKERYQNTKHITYISYDINPSELPLINGVVNLAGESLFGYWTNEKKKEIKESRITVTEKLVQLVERLEKKPEVFINGSAVGFYGPREKTIVTEDTTKGGEDFLSSVVVAWENTARKVENLGIRTVFVRFGIVLGKNGGALPLMALPVKLFVGGKVGDGEQWISWIHVEDAARLLHFCLFHREMEGPVNATAPHPLRNKDFYKELGKRYRRPIWFTIPKRLMQLVLGEMSVLITKGQYVYPKRALTHQFTFKYPKLQDALYE